MYEKAPLEECWRVAGKVCVGAKWVDKEIKRDKRKGSVCGGPAAGGKESVVLFAREHAGDVLGFRRGGEGLLPREG